MTIRLPAFFYQLAYLLLRIYGLIFRPRMNGVLCFVEYEGKILLVRHTYGAQKWNLPGGSMDDEESPERAIRRELSEEVRIVPTNLRLLKARVYGRRRSTVNYFHTVMRSPQFEIASGEIQEARWYAFDEMLPLLSPKERALFKKHLKGHSRF